MHRVVDATAAEPPLGEHLGTVLRTEQVVERHPDVLVDDVVVGARLRLDLDTRRLAGNHEHAVRAHDEEDVGDPTAGAEPLLAVDDPLVAVAHRMGPEQVRVRAALRLGHRVRRKDLLVQERLEPALLLRLGAVGGQHLHVPCVGRGGAEQGRGGAVATENLVEEAELELAVAGTAELLVKEDGPEALVLDLVLEALHERLDLRVLGADRIGEHVVERFHLLAAEVFHPVELFLEFGFRREVPGHGVSFFYGEADLRDLPPHALDPHGPTRHLRVFPPGRSAFKRANYSSPLAVLCPARLPARRPSVRRTRRA